MGCWGSSESSEFANQQKLFEKVYSGLVLNDALKNSSVAQQQRKQIVLQIYYTISDIILKNIQDSINNLQNTFIKSQHTTTCIQRIKQFMQSMQLFWTQILNTKNVIKKQSDKMNEELKKIKALLNKKIVPEMLNHNNQMVQKRSGIKKPLSNISARSQQQKLIERKQGKNKFQNQVEYKVQVRQNAQQSNRFTEGTGRLTEERVKSNQTYSLPINVIQIKQRQKESQQLQIQEGDDLIALRQMKKTFQDIVIQQNKRIQIGQLEIKELQNKLVQLQREGSSLKQTIKENLHLVQSLRTTNYRLEQANKQMLSQIQSLQRQKAHLQNRQKDLIYKQRANSLDLRVNSSICSMPNNSNLKQSDYYTILKYFCNSSLLPNLQKYEDAAKLRNQLTSMFPKNLKSTKLIYAFDPISQLHFNKYIQNKQNLLVLLALEKQIFIGGFAGQIDENQEVQDSFLFSVSALRPPIKLTAKQKVKKIDYASGLLNFGNGEISIKCRSLKFTCNVGGVHIMYFGEKYASIERFLGSQERSSLAKGLEIYEIQFEDAER